MPLRCGDAEIIRHCVYSKNLLLGSRGYVCALDDGWEDTMPRGIARVTADVSARKTYSLLAEPRDTEYRALLDSALPRCDTAVFLIAETQLNNVGRALVQQLQRFWKTRQNLENHERWGKIALYRYDFCHDSAAILKEANGLYAWMPPQVPANLCLLRNDGGPWLISSAAENEAYVELTPFEKLLLGRAAPALVPYLVNRASKDAALAVLEHRFEEVLEQLGASMEEYAASAAEGELGVVEAVREWLQSSEPARTTVALEIINRLMLDELYADVASARAQFRRGAAVTPSLYERYPILKERWQSRQARLFDDVLEHLTSSRAGNDDLDYLPPN